MFNLHIDGEQEWWQSGDSAPDAAAAWPDRSSWLDSGDSGLQRHGDGDGRADGRMDTGCGQMYWDLWRPSEENEVDPEADCVPQFSRWEVDQHKLLFIREKQKLIVSWEKDGEALDRFFPRFPLVCSVYQHAVIQEKEVFMQMQWEINVAFKLKATKVLAFFFIS